jgi:sugar phosphate isomerase/epimerase
MDLVQQIGGKRIAAPAAGATDVSEIDYLKVAERYRALLALGDHMGVVPQVEVWGFSKTLNRLGQAVLVAVESGHPRACVLPDVYHLYKGGSDFTGLKLLNGAAVHVFHMNDYPAQPPRQTIGDGDRVYPGDGVAPLAEILHTLREINFDGYLSVELFNPSYWQQDPLQVARLALSKMQSLTIEDCAAKER